jgi:membrane protein
MNKTRAPVAQAVASIGRTARLWRFGGLTPWELTVRSVRGYRENRLGRYSARFAYYCMLALCPLLIVLIAVIARLPISGVLENSLDAARRALGEEISGVLRRQVHDIQSHSTIGLIGAGLGVLTIAGSQVFLTITEGLNLAYGVKESRRSWQVYGMALFLNIAASLLLLVALVLMIAGPMLSTFVENHGPDMPVVATILRRGVRWAVVCTCLWIYTSAVYCLGPSVKLPWYWLSPGSAVAVAGWVIVSQGFRLYVESLGRYNETYGALGGVIVLMIWFNLTGAVLLMGGQINGVIHAAETARSSELSTPPTHSR